MGITTLSDKDETMNLYIFSVISVCLLAGDALFDGGDFVIVDYVDDAKQGLEASKNGHTEICDCVKPSMISVTTRRPDVSYVNEEHCYLVKKKVNYSPEDEHKDGDSDVIKKIKSDNADKDKETISVDKEAGDEIPEEVAVNVTDKLELPVPSPVDAKSQPNIVKATPIGDKKAPKKEDGIPKKVDEAKTVV